MSSPESEGVGPAAASSSHGTAPAGGGDPLDAIRAELEAIEEQPVAAHVAVYERVNAVLAAELSALDEV